MALDRFATVVGLICALLFAQIAGFAHAIEHLDAGHQHESTLGAGEPCDWCNAFSTVGTGAAAGTRFFAAAGRDERAILPSAVFDARRPFILCLSRAPPA